MLGSHETPSSHEVSASVGLCLECYIISTSACQSFSDSPQFPRLRLSPFFSGIPSSMGVLELVARWLCMARTRFRMQSAASAQRAYWTDDRRCFMIGLRTSPAVMMDPSGVNPFGVTTPPTEWPKLNRLQQDVSKKRSH